MKIETINLQFNDLFNLDEIQQVQDLNININR